MATHGKYVVVTQQPRQIGGFADKAHEMLATLSNRSFLSLAIAGVIGAVGSGLASGLGLVHIATYFWELSSREISYLVGFGFVSAMLGVSLAPAVSKWMGRAGPDHPIRHIPGGWCHPDPPAAPWPHATEPLFLTARDPVG